MTEIKQEMFSRKFDSRQLLKDKTKEVKTWQWVILLCCFLFQMFPYCVALNLTNIFMPTDWTIWTEGNQTIMSITFTVGALGAAVVGPFIAKIFKKEINMRIVYSIGVFMAMLGFFGSGINALIPASTRTPAIAAVILYIFNLISQIGVMVFSGLGINNLISKWWPVERRGFALGIAFMGGSMGNIWMQQLVAVLARKFGNSLGLGEATDGGNGYRWASYLILAAMGLVTGIVVAIIACRKPVPPTEIFGFNNQKNLPTSIICVGCKQERTVQLEQTNALEASVLVTRKYPPYWILAIGYLILQMGTIHSSLYGVFIRNGTLVDNQGSFNTVLAIGGTLFGLSCLIGNFMGGVLNDKLGPNKSIALAGTLQIGALFCLLFSIKIEWLVYCYFIFAGLSVYIYTSTPSFISGRLYGAKQSNSHMSILGIFIAVGFAIANSIAGSITGPVNSSNSHDLLGKTVYGNLLGIVLFAIVCMLVGCLIVVICTTIILRKGIKGLLEYSPTKYTRVINAKYPSIWWNTLLVWMTGDYNVVLKKYNQIKANEKYAKNVNYQSIKHFKMNINAYLAKRALKLSNDKIEILALIYMNKYITSKALEGYKDVESQLNELIKQELIEEKVLGQNSKYYVLSDTITKNLDSLNLNNKIIEENGWISHKLDLIELQSNKKNTILKNKLDVVQNDKIDQTKQTKNLEKMNLKLAKLAKLKIRKLAKVNELSDWNAYKLEYDLLIQEQKIKELEFKEENILKTKIANIQKKMFITNFISNYEKIQQIEGHNLLVNYYNSPYEHIVKLIDKNIEQQFNRKNAVIDSKTQTLQKIFNQLKMKEQKIQNSRNKNN